MRGQSEEASPMDSKYTNQIYFEALFSKWKGMIDYEENLVVYFVLCDDYIHHGASLCHRSVFLK